MRSMTDLEITKLCAVAMGFDRLDEKDFLNRPIMLAVKIHSDGAEAKFTFDPLHDDAQAMALVKRFGMRVEKMAGKQGLWRAQYTEPSGNYGAHRIASDLNRAICECVANMRKANGT